MHSRLTTLFPLFAISAALVAWLQPHWFRPFANSIVPILALIMFTMGMTLSKADFIRVLNRKTVVSLGVAIQFAVMPLIAFVMAKLFGLSNDLLIGMVLVGSASGGTASNVICYLAHGDVALSISMTLASTLLAIVALPALSWLYLGQVVPVPMGGMFISVLKIVLVPLFFGVAANHYAHATVARITHSLPVITTIAVVFIIAIIVALNQDKLATISGLLITAVVLHNAIGLSAGYSLARALKHDEATCRTIAIEVGMQNSGLAVALAVKYFSPLAALPGALFSVWHNVSGSLLAAIWSRK